MHIHHIFSGLCIVKHLGPFEDPGAADAIGVLHLQGIPHELPVDKVFRGVAAYIPVLRIESLTSLLAVPIVLLSYTDDATAMGLNVVAIGVGPNLRRPDNFVLG